MSSSESKPKEALEKSDAQNPSGDASNLQFDSNQEFQKLVVDKASNKAINQAFLETNIDDLHMHDDLYTHNFKNDANLIQTKNPSDKTISGNSGSSEAEKQLTMQRDRLNHRVHELPPEQQKRMANYERTFEARSKQMEENYRKEISHDHPELRSNLTEIAKQAHKRAVTEIAGTYDAVTDLLETKSQIAGVTDTIRANAAEQILRHAAEPSNINQGQYNTCSMQALESRLYHRTPSKVAHMVTDVLISGQYSTNTKDHFPINIDANSILPQGESRNFNSVQSNKRDHISQVFAVAASNTYYEHPEIDTGIRYEQRPEIKGDNGETLIDYSKNPPLGEVVRDKDGPVKAPSYASTPDALLLINEQITGKREDGWILEGPLGYSEKSIKVGGPHDLAAKLKEALDNGKGPLALRVHTGNEQFSTFQRGGVTLSIAGTGNWHLVLIDGYTRSSVPGQDPDFSLNNQWGPQNDHPHAKATDLFRSTVTAELPVLPKESELVHKPSVSKLKSDLFDAHDFDTHDFVEKSDFHKLLDKIDNDLNYNIDSDVRPDALELARAANKLPLKERMLVIQHLVDEGLIDSPFNNTSLEQ